ncbi:hypothetical protein, partial [Arthrobacter sp. H5]
ATSYQDLLAHMATRTRNTTKLTKPQTPEHDSINGQHEPASDLTFELLTVPTARQRRAMDLVDHHARNHRK